MLPRFTGEGFSFGGAGHGGAAAEDAHAVEMFFGQEKMGAGGPEVLAAAREIQLGQSATRMEADLVVHRP